LAFGTGKRSPTIHIARSNIKEVYAEAKGTGFEPKIMRQLIKIRKMDKNEHDEQESLLDLYQRAIGMLPDPTAEAAE
jgi:uncharacterized protein (UPF0335 family)